jgi:hypothetical protein
MAHRAEVVSKQIREVVVTSRIFCWWRSKICGLVYRKCATQIMTITKRAV